MISKRGAFNTTVASHVAGAVITDAVSYVATATNAPAFTAETNVSVAPSATTQLVLSITDAYQVQQDTTNHIEVRVNLTGPANMTENLQLELQAQDGTIVNAVLDGHVQRRRRRLGHLRRLRPDRHDHAAYAPGRPGGRKHGRRLASSSSPTTASYPVIGHELVAATAAHDARQRGAQRHGHRHPDHVRPGHEPEHVNANTTLRSSSRTGCTLMGPLGAITATLGAVHAHRRPGRHAGRARQSRVRDPVPDADAERDVLPEHLARTHHRQRLLQFHGQHTATRSTPT